LLPACLPRVSYFSGKDFFLLAWSCSFLSLFEHFLPAACMLHSPLLQAGGSVWYFFNKYLLSIYYVSYWAQCCVEE
jgi:hypothetical protein